MPKYKIGWEYGYAGEGNQDFIEAENQEDAEEQAWEKAIESVCSWAEEISEEEYKENR